MGESTTLARDVGRRPSIGGASPEHAQSAPPAADEVGRAPRALGRLSAGAGGGRPGGLGRWPHSEMQVDPEDILALQRAAGNGAVVQLLATGERRRPPLPGSTVGGEAAGAAPQAARSPAPQASGIQGAPAPAPDAPFGSLPSEGVDDLSAHLDRTAARVAASAAAPAEPSGSGPRGGAHAPPVRSRVGPVVTPSTQEPPAAEPPSGDALDGSGGGGEPALAGAAAGAPPPIVPAFQLPSDPGNALVGAAIVDAGIAGILSLSEAANAGLAQVEARVGEQRAVIDTESAAQSRAVSGAVGGARARVTSKVAQAKGQLAQAGAGERARLDDALATQQSRAAEVATAAETRTRATGTRRGDDA